MQRSFFKAEICYRVHPVNRNMLKFTESVKSSGRGKIKPRSPLTADNRVAVKDSASNWLEIN